MEREREIRAFVPEKFWKILGLFETLKKDKITLTCSEEPRDEKLFDKIMTEGKKGSWIVKGVKESEQKRSPRAPFTTSTLQQTASSRLGYSPSRTMQIAQKLYEAGHITYMRTDSTNLSVTAVAQILAFVKKEYGDNYAETRIYKTKSKNAQEAHEAIRPTHIDKLQAGTDDQSKLYKLIWERAVSSQMTEAKLLKTKITANVSVEDGPSQNAEGPSSTFPDFAANGSRLLFPGWLAVDTGARGEDVELPLCKEGEKLKLLGLSGEEKYTEPLGRYSEAGLIKELEARGIGRPSTYASIMRTIEDRGYVRKEGKTLFPTDVGEVVSDFLEAHFANYISDTFTAGMEDKLDEISRGETEYEKTLKDFYTPFLKDIKIKELAFGIIDKAPKSRIYVALKKELIKDFQICGFQEIKKIPEGIKLKRGEKCLLFNKKKYFEENEFRKKPDLIVIDGGKGQLSQGLIVQKEFKMNIPMIGLAKKNEEIYIPKQSLPIALPKDSEALYLLQQIRDEAHRFAIAYHQKLREKGLIK